jgi:phosphoserine phosphatase RsbU/P
VHDYARHLEDLNTIMAVSRAMSSERDLDRLLGLIMDAATRLIDADRSSLFIVDHERKELWTRVAQNADTIRLPIGKGIAGTVAERAKTINIPDAYRDERFDRENDRRSGYRTHSILCMPLVNSNDVVVGVIQALNRRNDMHHAPQGDLPDESGENDTAAFSAYDEQVLAALCSQAAVAIDNAQLIARDRERQALAREMELARRIQLSLLPSQPPSHPRWRFAAYARSCDQTGGDYYDFIAAAGATEVVVGDVSGHGIGAAMMMSTARAFLRALHEQPGSLAEIMAKLNRLLELDMADDAFMSLAIVRLADDGRCEFVSAGHEPPLVYRAKPRSFDALDSTGLPLGMIEDAAYDTASVQPIVAGDIVVLFTDGVFEAQRPGSDETFGMERLKQVVASESANGAQAVCDGIIAAVDGFLGGTQAHDDITLVVAERR